MTEAQKRTVDRIVNECYARDSEFHHSDWIGADVEAVEIAQMAGDRIIVHPPAACTKRAFTPGDVIEPAKPYLDRNRDIVNRAHLLIATPKGASRRAAQRHVGHGSVRPTTRDSGPDHPPRRERHVTVFAFDVDETLEVSGGPVTLGAVIELYRAGHIVGLCGNWAVVTQRVVGWHKLFSFLNAGGVPKDIFLRDLRMWIPADDFVMVGNILGVSGSSDDQGAAQRAGWRFLSEAEFAAGKR